MESDNSNIFEHSNINRKNSNKTECFLEFFIIHKNDILIYLLNNSTFSSIDSIHNSNTTIDNDFLMIAIETDSAEII